jgi:hypothetical protein
MWGHVLQTLLDKFVRLHGQVEIWKGKKKNYFTFPWGNLNLKKTTFLLVCDYYF